MHITSYRTLYTIIIALKCFNVLPRRREHRTSVRGEYLSPIENSIGNGEIETPDLLSTSLMRYQLSSPDWISAPHIFLTPSSPSVKLLCSLPCVLVSHNHKPPSPLHDVIYANPVNFGFVWVPVTQIRW